MKNSLRQMLRTPFKLLLFVLLIGASTVLLTLGIRLWLETREKLAQAEETFTTIGMVRQKENLIETGPVWDAGTKSYTSYSFPVYEEVLSESILNAEGADYVAGPEKRPFYGAYLPDYRLTQEGTPVLHNLFVAEISPIEDCIPSQPVRVNIERVLYGSSKESAQCWFCDHNNPNPPLMEKGKTYIVYLFPISSNHLDREEVSVECIPYSQWPSASQYSKTGEKIPESPAWSQELEDCRWEEVTEDFYTSGRGVYWLNFIEMQKKEEKRVFVLPTDSLSLLPSFHEKETVIVDGREISKEEFTQGTSVCLVSQDFAVNNGLKPGDRIPLSLYYADYAASPGQGSYTYGCLNAKGEPYQPFWEEEYEIVGIYKYTPSENKEPSSVEIGMDTIIIPGKSVKVSDENNILAYGPMLKSTTSFQIPNGSGAAFLKLFQEKANADFLEITIDDNGYEQVHRELEHVGNAALLLGAAGLLLAASVLLLLVYFFIVKQKRRTAIERSLGMSKGQCRKSLLAGILLFTLLGAVFGSLVGKTLYTKTQEMLVKEEVPVFDRTYSIWAAQETSLNMEHREAEQRQTSPWGEVVYLGVPLLLFLWMLGLSWYFTDRNLKIPPMEVLSMRE